MAKGKIYRVQFDLDVVTLRKLDKLKSSFGETTRAGVFRHMLRVCTELARHEAAGLSIAAVPFGGGCVTMISLA